MRVLVLLLCATWLGLCSSGIAAPSLPSVVSTNLCADLLLLRLGAPGQIRSVSYQAQNPAQSPVAERARQYPANRGAVEELLYFDPKIALTYLGWSGRPHAELLAERGMQVVTLPYPRTIEDAFSMTTAIAQAIGRDAAGQRAVTQARARVKALSNTAATWHPAPRVLYLRPNGGTAGSETYVDAMLNLLGLRNLAADKGMRGWGTLPLERLVADPPDLFLLGYFDQAQPQSKSRYGRHPLLRKLLQQVPSIQLPSSTAWGCGGLELIDAAALIAEQLATPVTP
jgi:iron complex transport system substrate-binding protein